MPRKPEVSKMDSPHVSPELANAALMLNRKFGTICAWRFLFQNDVSNDTIYALLKNACGPASRSDAGNIELWSLIEKANNGRR
jgi:hypothetical protein